MTKKHFESLALHLADVRPIVADGGNSRHIWLESVGAVADSLALSNPRFDRSRFIDACESYVAIIRDGRLVKQ